MEKLSVIRLCLLLLLFPSVLCAGPLDDYYLSRFAPPVKSAQLSATSGETAATAPHRHGDHCRTMLLLRLKREWNQLETETQQILAKQLAAPQLSDRKSYDSAHFTIHYSNSGSDAPNLADGNGNGHPEWVENVAAVFENVYRVEVTEMGYRPPPGSGRYSVYVRNLAPEGVYGYATPVAYVSAGSGSMTSYIEIDNGYTDYIYRGYDADENLMVTAAHEFHHAIQFGYNAWFEMWYGEATATWMEDEVYDDVNQLYRYLNYYLPSSNTISLEAAIDGGSEYGRWIFNRFLAERHTPLLIREIWQDLGTKPRQNIEIPAIPLIDTALVKRGSSFQKEFTGFAGIVYRRDWRTHVDDIDDIPVVSPVSASNLYLPNYAFSYYRFVPSAMSPGYLRLDLPGLSSNATAVAYRKGNDGIITSYTRDTQTGAIYVPFFVSRLTSEVVLAINSNGGSVAFAFSAAEVEPPQRFLTVALAGSGGGAVSGAINCNSGMSCTPVPFADQSVVTLLASPDSNSLFGGWSAPCTVNGNNCELTLTSDLSVTATFTASPPVRIAQGASYSLLSSALAAAGNGATIQAREVIFTETLLFNRPLTTVSLQGGYDAGYRTRPGFSTIDGSLRIRSGTVRVNGLVVR